MIINSPISWMWRNYYWSSPAGGCENFPSRHAKGSRITAECQTGNRRAAWWSGPRTEILGGCGRGWPNEEAYGWFAKSFHVPLRYHAYRRCRPSGLPQKRGWQNLSCAVGFFFCALPRLRQQPISNLLYFLALRPRKL